MEDQNFEGTIAPSEEIVAEGQFQEAAPESAPEEAPEKPKEPSPEEQQFAAKFAALSRKEKQIRDRERALQQQMSAMEQRMKELEEGRNEVSKYKELPNRLKKEPLKVLEESGLTFEQLAEMVLNDGKPTPDMHLQEVLTPVQQKIKELEEKLAAKETAEQESRLEAQLQQFMGQLTDFVNNTEDYDLIRANDAVDLVYDVIEQHHSETGEILSNKEAADAVENYLLEEAKKLVDRDKVKKLLGGGSSAKETAPRKAQPTLSNDQVAQSSQPVKPHMSDEESKAAAARLIRWGD